MKLRHIGLLTVGAWLALASSGGASEKQESFNGYAEWRVGDLLIVDGQRIRMSDSTKLELHGQAGGFGSIPLGFEVKGKGRRLPDGVLLAERLEVKPNGVALFERELAATSDAMEQEFRRRGRVFDADEYDRIVMDYGRLLESGSHVDRVRQIAGRVMPPYLTAGDYRVYVVENEEWNAMAAPNGSIYVFTGLLEELNDEEVALVLSHELAHLTHEHSRKQFKRGLLTQLAVLAPLAIADQTIESDTKRFALHGAAAVGLLAIQNRYSREQEDQADRVGLRYAYQGDYDVRSGPTLWRRFAEKYGNGNKVLNFFLGSHSLKMKRAENLERQIELNYRW